MELLHNRVYFYFHFEVILLIAYEQWKLEPGSFKISIKQQYNTIF